MEIAGVLEVDANKFTLHIKEQAPRLRIINHSQRIGLYVTVVREAITHSRHAQDAIYRAGCQVLENAFARFPILEVRRGSGHVNKVAVGIDGLAVPLYRVRPVINAGWRWLLGQH